MEGPIAVNASDVLSAGLSAECAEALLRKHVPSRGAAVVKVVAVAGFEEPRDVQLQAFKSDL
eukprot:2080002-Lingulodinium_polyedra.AAC.1